MNHALDGIDEGEGEIRLVTALNERQKTRLHFPPQDRVAGDPGIGFPQQDTQLGDAGAVEGQAPLAECQGGGVVAFLEGAFGELRQVPGLGVVGGELLKDPIRGEGGLLATVCGGGKLAWIVTGRSGFGCPVSGCGVAHGRRIDA